MEKITKNKAKERIQEFFSDVTNKTPKDIKKIKSLAMSFNIRLSQHKKKFCTKCLNPYTNPKIRIKNKFKTTTCQTCGNIRKWKLTKISQTLKIS